uniref:NADH dehydrogenase subunit 2 n=1 Tax=Rhynchospio aff. asiatica ZW-2021 TaxID=2813871 RepID=UPI0023AA3F04|nr:NADH dehydrogenase subunit 2 [Rhynchospio aff. asiatica ZW-2021]WCI21134.1 NADH dehydrogenase subunit 2 [Rhynchospio aff. asiatica ZW-2021]
MSSFLYTLMFSSTLSLSTLLALSSPSWLVLWVALELNMLSFIPLIIFSSWHQETEAAIKYFLFQALGSALLLLGASTFNLPLFIFIGLIIKLGMAPFHFWFPSVMAAMSWPMSFLLLTWQKVIPMFIVCYSTDIPKTYIIASLGCLNAIIGGIGGLNQTQIRPLLAYSSLGHMAWMLVVSEEHLSIHSFYFLVYLITSGALTLYLFYLGSSTTLLASPTPSMNFFSTLILSTLLLSLGGLPPLTGFFPKWLILNYCVSSLTPLILIFGAVINLFYYLNISISMMISKTSTSSLSLRTSLLSAYPAFIISSAALPLAFIATGPTTMF